MPANRKASDDQIIAAYQEAGSVWGAAKRLGMCGQSVHERLTKLGKATPINHFTEVEADRLREEYWAAADAGKLADLAADMGRTKQFLCRKAKEMGLTDKRRKKVYASVWKYVTEEYARGIFEKFKASAKNLGQFCRSMGYDDLGFSVCMKRYFPDEWEHVIESKQTSQTWYRLGRQFEYRVRDDLRGKGYFAQRSPGSKTPIDITAISPGRVLLIQCKRGSGISVAEWNEVYDLAVSCGAIPILASSPTGRGISYHRMMQRKDGSKRRQPIEEYAP